MTVIPLAFVVFDIISAISFVYCSGAKYRSHLHPLLRMLILGIVLCTCGCQSTLSRLETVDTAAQHSVEVQGRISGEDMHNPLYHNLTTTRRILRQRLLGAQGWETEAQGKNFPAYSEADISDISAPEESAEMPVLSLADALQIAAHYSREFQAQKERVFDAALVLDLEEERFRTIWEGVLSTLWSTDNSSSERRTGLTHQGDGGLEQLFKNGISFSLAAGLDLVQLLGASARAVRRGVGAYGGAV